MKRYFSLLLLGLMVVILGGCASLKDSGVIPKSKLSTHDLVAQEGGATVALMMYRDDKDTTLTTGYRPFCTGVWVDDTHILTADHCAKAEQEHQQDRLDERKKEAENEVMTLQQMLQKLFGGGSMSEAEPDKIEEKGLVVHFITENEVIEVGKEPSAWHMSKVVAFDEKHDLALLEAVGKAVPGHRVAKLAKETPEVGETVHIVGQTIGMYWTYIQGNVAAYRGADMIKGGKDGPGDTGPWMQVASPMYFGNSGGGAFNDYGELVGIADWIKRAPEMGFFVHLDTIKSFLDTNLKK
jgi:S1-C subfamily serine protease